MYGPAGLLPSWAFPPFDLSPVAPAAGLFLFQGRGRCYLGRMDLDRIFRAERATKPETRHRAGLPAHVLRLRALARALPQIHEREMVRIARRDVFHDRMERWKADQRETRRQNMLRQIELIRLHPSASGVRFLARLAQDPRQDDEVRVRASRLILALAAPKNQEDPWTF